MTHPYPFAPDTGRRRTMAEAAQWVEEHYGAAFVNGFDEIVALEGATHNNRRVASFGEFTPYEAWVVDQRQGGSFIRWASAPVPRGESPYVIFILSIGLGNGSALPQPTGRFDLFLNGRLLAAMRVLKHSETWESGAARLHYSVKRLESAPRGLGLVLDSVVREEAFASFGLLLIRVPRSWTEPGRPAQFEVRPFNRAASTQWFKVDKGTNVRFHSNYFAGLEALAAGRVVPRLGAYNAYFGDIHNHSGESCDAYGTCGVGAVDDLYQYAAQVSNLDFFALTEHDWQTGKGHWEHLMQKVEAYNRPGRFATIPAFEWTSLAYGHRNVYYADPNQPFFLSWQEAQAGGQRQPLGQVDSPVELWRKLDQLHTFALTAPHHPPAASHPLNWAYVNPKYDRFVEIYSCWGSSEFPENSMKGHGADRFAHLYVRAALDAGHRLGFTASSDSHDGNPGNAQSPDVKHHHLYHYLGSGLTVALAPDLSRESVLQALHDRRCYAVTGEPILLDFRVSGQIMGSELTVDQAGRRPVLTAAVTGTTHLTRLEIIKNGRTVWRQEPLEEQFNQDTVEWVDESLDTSRPNYYYFKVTQRDGEMARWPGRRRFGSARRKPTPVPLHTQRQSKGAEHAPTEVDKPCST